jgi:hypothetical protein
MTRLCEYKGEKIFINWQRLSKEDEAGDGYTFMYGAEGISEDGRIWGATWIECLDEVEIEDIELCKE